MTGQRADARRNYQRILEVAVQEVARNGSAASMEQIARTAGVGSATVRRHFPTRQDLLEAVFATRTQALCDSARELSASEDSRGALVTWLGQLVDYSVSARGFADVLSFEPPTETCGPHSCGAMLAHAATPLLSNAVRDGTVRPDVTFTDLLTLVTGIALATEHHPDPAPRAHHLLRLTTEGLSPADEHPPTRTPTDEPPPTKTPAGKRPAPEVPPTKTPTGEGPPRTA